MNPLLLICRERLTNYNRYGNINPLSIAYATRLGLGPTNPGMITMAQETLLFSFGGQDSHLPYGYSFQHSHLIPLHQTSQSSFDADINAPLPHAT